MRQTICRLTIAGATTVLSVLVLLLLPLIFSPSLVLAQYFVESVHPPIYATGLRIRSNRNLIGTFRPRPYLPYPYGLPDGPQAAAFGHAIRDLTGFQPTERETPSISMDLRTVHNRRKPGRWCFDLVVAYTRKMGIGNNGTLPWPRLSKDMAHFVDKTKTAPEGMVNAVIMGRKTWDSIPLALRPLKGRYNIVITSQGDITPPLSTLSATAIASSLPHALELAAAVPRLNNVLVIGGASLFSLALYSPFCAHIHATEVLTDFPCDTFMPPIPAHFAITEQPPVCFDGERGDVPLAFLTYTNMHQHPAFACRGRPTSQSAAAASVVESKAGDTDIALSFPFSHPHTPCPPLTPIPVSPPLPNLEEMQYLNLVRTVLTHGTLKEDRTGVGTLSIFGAQMRFSLRNGRFPLLTTKRVFLRGVAEELFWFIRGDTNAKHLQEKKVHIWDGNASLEFLRKCGFTDRKEGDLGPVYGFQWRHFGAQYTTCDADYTGKGVDQLQQLIDDIRTQPHSRRLLLTAWNPAAVPEMALPPCHVLSQWAVCNGELSCQLYQRSADLGLGVPFNIASYALLTVVLARLTGLQPGQLVHTIGDAHVYTTHIQPLTQQLQRTPRAFPTLRLRDRPYADVTDVQWDDVIVEGYEPHANIKMDMAV